MAGPGKVGETYRYWWAAKQGIGSLRTGLGPGDFTVTVVNPSDAASSTPAAAQSTQKPGMYYADIPGAFLTVAGQYGITVELTTSPLDSFGDSLDVFARDFDDLAQPGDQMDLVNDAVDAASVASGAIDAGDWTTAALQELADHLETNGTNPHGTGAWDATATVPAQTIRNALALTNTGPAPVAGSIDQYLLDIQGTGFVTGTHSLVAIRTQGDAAWTTAVGFSTLTAADVWDYDISANYDGVTDRDMAGGAARWSRMLSVNRQEMSFGPDRQNVYDDAGTVIVSFAPIADGAGNPLTLLVGAPARRTAAFS